MKKLLPFTLPALFLGALLSPSITAAPQIDLKTLAACTDIVDETKRLSCFDKVTQNLKKTKQAQKQVDENLKVTDKNLKPADKKLVETLPPVKKSESEKKAKSATTPEKPEKPEKPLFSSEDAFGKTEAEINEIGRASCRERV